VLMRTIAASTRTGDSTKSLSHEERDDDPHLDVGYAEDSFERPIIVGVVAATGRPCSRQSAGRAAEHGRASKGVRAKLVSIQARLADSTVRVSVVRDDSEVHTYASVASSKNTGVRAAF